MCTYWLTGEDSTRTRKNSTESSNADKKQEEDTVVQQSMHSSPPKNGVIGFGQDGGEPYNFDLNQTSPTAVTNNNNFQACENGKNNIWT